ncbi:MAG: hypothetical protein QOE38_1957 [Thermoleophilaceae bacterium]|nr:hypothetical protein [Thermoleophilaceae bacterium]
MCYCDGQPATTAQLSFPADVAVTSDGGFLIADNDNNRIRKVSSFGGTIGVVQIPVRIAPKAGGRAVSGDADRAARVIQGAGSN